MTTFMNFKMIINITTYWFNELNKWNVPKKFNYNELKAKYKYMKNELIIIIKLSKIILITQNAEYCDLQILVGLDLIKTCITNE
jgi:hypothetical protein